MHQSVEFPFEARYAQLGNVDSATKQLWIVIHGYGQLAQYFIKKFETLREKQVAVIAPEGLSRFYVENIDSRMRTGNNRVGATWMTREDRLTDIRNYIRYLDTVYAQVISAGKLPVTVLGFSQGAATAVRWVVSSNVNIDRLVLWAGIFPPDMDFEAGRQVLRNKKVVSVYGTQDPFLNDDRFTEMRMLSEKLDVVPETITFDGKHDIDAPTLLSLV